MLKNNREYLYLFILLIISTILFCFNITAWHNWGGDHSSYIMQAQSILDGSIQDFIEKNTFLINNTDDITLAPIAYPWGFPLYLSGFLALFGSSIYVFKSAIFLTFILFILTMYVYFRKTLTPLQNLFLIACFCFNAFMYEFFDSIFSDIPFLFLSTLGVLFLHDSVRTNNLTIKKVFIFAIIAFIASTIRGNGLLLMFLLFIAQVFIFFRDKNRNVFFYIMPYLVYMGLNSIFNYIFPSSAGVHIEIFKTMTWHTVIENIKFYSVLLSHFFQFTGHVDYVIYFVTLPFFLYGLYKNYKIDFLFILYSGMTIGLFVLFPPSSQGLRYIFPVLPFYIYFLIVGAAAIFPDKKLTYPFYVISIVFLCNSILNVPTHPIDKSPYADTSKEVFQFIRENTQEDEIFVFYKPRVLRLETGRNGMHKDGIGELNYDYILYYNLQKRFPISEKDIETLIQLGKAKTAFTNEAFRLIKIIHSSDKKE